MKIEPSQIVRLKSQHQSIDAIISGLSERQLNRNPAPEKWSIHANLAHLGSYQLLFTDRLKKILTGSEPAFGSYRAADDPLFSEWLQKPASEILTQLAADRGMLADRLMALPVAELVKAGSHARFGRLAVPEWTEFFLLHEAHHIYTIFQLAHASI